MLEGLLHLGVDVLKEGREIVGPRPLGGDDVGEGTEADVWRWSDGSGGGEDEAEPLLRHDECDEDVAGGDQALAEIHHGVYVALPWVWHRHDMDAGNFTVGVDGTHIVALTGPLPPLRLRLISSNRLLLSSFCLGVCTPLFLKFSTHNMFMSSRHRDGCRNLFCFENFNRRRIFFKFY